MNESGDLAAISVLGLAMLAITFAVVLAVNQIPGGGNAAAGLRNNWAVAPANPKTHHPWRRW